MRELAPETIRATRTRDRDNRIRARPIKVLNIQIRARSIKVLPIRARRRLSRIRVIPTGIMPIETMLIATTTTMRMSAHLRYVPMVTTRTIRTPARLTASTVRGGLQAECSSVPARGMALAGATADIGVVVDTGAAADTGVAATQVAGASLVVEATSGVAMPDAAMPDTVTLVAESTEAVRFAVAAASMVEVAAMVVADSTVAAGTVVDTGNL